MMAVSNENPPALVAIKDNNITVQLAAELLTCWPQTALFAEIMQTQGVVYRQMDNRTTLRFMHNDAGYFIKKHAGVGWFEIIKNLLCGRLPIIGAKDEFIALNRLQELGLSAPLVVGFGELGKNPAAKQSFLITREIADVQSLDTMEAAWKQGALSWQLKQQLIQEIARITRVLHQHGINHRDLYACHFMIKQSITDNLDISLMDLHRAQLRIKTPLRWIIKDLASLYYSILNFHLTKRDLLRFIAYYSNQPWQLEMTQNRHFWMLVEKRTRHFIRRHNKFFKTPIGI